jgi:hypothetical protein
MRVAVLFFGRVRHYEKKYLVNSLPESCQCDFFYSADAESEESIGKFIEIYKPISINNEKISYIVNFRTYPTSINKCTNVHNMTCHFINKKRVFELLETHVRKTGVKYDIVISTRLDLFIEKIDLPMPLPNTIYIPVSNDYSGINDRFAMGDYETMGKYMKIYDNCVYLLENDLTCAHPETMTLANLNYYKINIRRFGMHYSIIR